MNRQHSQRGSATLELVVVVPGLILLLLLAAAANRVIAARLDVQAAAAEGARAATLEQSPTAAAAAARRAARAALSGAGRACRRLDVQTRTRRLTAGTPGSTIEARTVRVACEVSFGGLHGLGLPGSRQVTHSATEVIDKFRGV